MNHKKKKIAGVPINARGRIFKKKSPLPAKPDLNGYLDLGVIHASKGNYDEAAACFKKVISINPEFDTGLYNLGYVLQEQGKLVESITCFKKVLVLNPNHLDALYNLGVVYLKQEKNKEAANCLKKVLAITPDHLSANLNLSVVCTRQYKLAEAVSYLEKVLKIDPRCHDALYNLGIILKMQGKVGDAFNCFNEALVFKPDFPQARTSLAIISWINGDWETCRYHLDLISASKEILIEEDIKLVVPYRNFLDKLLAYLALNANRYEINANLPAIYVVGDSHSLSTANTTVIFKGVKFFTKANIVVGCKAWHLANNKLNRFKYEFEKIIGSLPFGATLVLMFGEIDCRLDEGIIKNYKKGNVDLTWSIETLVDNYVNYISKILTSKGVNPIICNVPAQLIEKNKIPDTDIKLQEEVLARFNRALADNAELKQIPILDVYTFSKTQNAGFANVCHIDRYHLRPSVFENLLKQL